MRAVAKRLKELTVTIDYETHRFGTGEPFTVILDGHIADDEAGEEITLKGPTEDGHPQQHLTYRFYGQKTHYKGKPQFKYTTFVHQAPHSRSGIIKYLTNAPHIGNVIARRLWDIYKGDAVRMLRTQPEQVAAETPRLSEDAAIEAAAWLEREKALEDCTIEIVDLLEGHGPPRGVVKQAIKEWGNLAATIIRKNPYVMMRFRGVGFKRCDALYLELGGDPAKLKRQALCAWYHLAANTEGDTWFYRTVVEVGLNGAIGGAKVRSDQAITLANRASLISTIRTDDLHGIPDWDGSHHWMAEGRKARNELKLATYVCEALEEK